MTKLERIGADLKRAREKQAEWNQRVKDLENRYREEERCHPFHGARCQSDAGAARPDHLTGRPGDCRCLSAAEQRIGL